MKLQVITSNLGKLNEFRTALPNIEIIHNDVDCYEIQADTLEEVVNSCIDQLRSKKLNDFVLDDSGLFVDGLGGFPGVYSSYVLRTIGNEGLLKLMENTSDRTARFKSCVGACIGSHIIIANGECQGKINFSQKGNGGFGFDPIFIPDGYDTTFAEMTLEEKNKISHRGNSIRSFAEQFTNIFESD
ncbi:hypothetical protein A3206_06740 [Candidatus Methanomassiliicoccus intestinalis]|uniref:dITP/XTP pyrophosphatase n=1 Tax=Methanomassiliicoccus intestinalis (strain Issoire-Mx1) TaxID=1295009 RepID=R9T958_METII|nr:RdgB/HAM1 family non-canonical purine NTP pyrophosphatase [Candidatus Methanomassiliicoccus intestinalis]AGN25918.1 deoxyribonucleotide triphosphate pyrophosphatase [Candidatus Methanomassiliicoccus intestinalis Issoire-Mx1]TQS83333.1 MAG: hypothetical protein A3206_06740 [Candidatus Methanomassiliicoccus intestinalis]